MNLATYYRTALIDTDTPRFTDYTAVIDLTCPHPNTTTDIDLRIEATDHLEDPEVYTNPNNTTIYLWQTGVGTLGDPTNTLITAAIAALTAEGFHPNGQWTINNNTISVPVGVHA